MAADEVKPKLPAEARRALAATFRAIMLRKYPGRGIVVTWESDASEAQLARAARRRTDNTKRGA
jgi:hypothetical protein